MREPRLIRDAVHPVAQFIAFGLEHIAGGAIVLRSWDVLYRLGHMQCHQKTGVRTPVVRHHNSPRWFRLLAQCSRVYRDLFGALFPSVAGGGPIDFSLFGLAIAEF